MARGANQAPPDSESRMKLAGMLVSLPASALTLFATPAMPQD